MRFILVMEVTRQTDLHARARNVINMRVLTISQGYDRMHWNLAQRAHQSRAPPRRER